MDRNPDDSWCLEHNTYIEACLYHHDPPNKNDLPDPWPPAGPDEEDDDDD